MDLLSEISWKDYTCMVALILLLYYAYVLRRYYAAEIKNLFTRLTKSSFDPAPKEARLRYLEHTGEEENKGRSDASIALENIDDLTNRIHNFFSGVSTTSPTKEEIKKYIGLLLEEYQQIIDEPVRQVINQLILSECEKHCTVLLSEEDVNMLWKKQ